MFKNLEELITVIRQRKESSPEDSYTKKLLKDKKLSIENLKLFKDKFDLPIGDDELDDPPFLKLKEDSKEMKYLHDMRKNLKG